VLRAVARILRDGCRQIDLVARYGGEEFALVLVETPPASAALLCEKLRAAVESYDWPSLHPRLARVTLSFGLSGDLTLPDPAALLASADARLYQAKRTGRNRVCH
jgi:diguanylate cyclase (GGDEF)-like protein